jgi:hypothetical protein
LAIDKRASLTSEAAAPQAPAGDGQSHRPYQLPQGLREYYGIGQPLPDGVRGQMEGSFGTSFADVRVHQGAQADALGARALTSGSDIHFAPGEYQPESRAGLEVLGHELVHVEQQRAGRVNVPQGKGGLVNEDAALESEADRLGAQAAAGEPVRVPGAEGARAASGGPIQRLKRDTKPIAINQLDLPDCQRHLELLRAGRPDQGVVYEDGDERKLIDQLKELAGGSALDEMRFGRDKKLVEGGVNVGGTVSAVRDGLVMNVMTDVSEALGDVPDEPSVSTEQVKEIARKIAGRLRSSHPKETALEMPKEREPGEEGEDETPLKRLLNDFTLYMGYIREAMLPEDEGPLLGATDGSCGKTTNAFTHLYLDDSSNPNGSSGDVGKMSDASVMNEHRGALANKTFLPPSAEPTELEEKQKAQKKEQRKEEVASEAKKRGIVSGVGVDGLEKAIMASTEPLFIQINMDLAGRGGLQFGHSYFIEQRPRTLPSDPPFGFIYQSFMANHSLARWIEAHQGPNVPLRDHLNALRKMTATTTSKETRNREFKDAYFLPGDKDYAGFEADEKSLVEGRLELVYLVKPFNLERARANLEHVKTH